MATDRSSISKPDQVSAIVWMLDANTVTEGDLEFFVGRLGSDENRRYQNFARRQRQLQFLLGRILVRLALADLTGMAPDTLGVIDRPGRAPQLQPLPWPCLEPSFSISHSRQWIACVTGAGIKLGIDVEVSDCSRDIAALSRMALERDERRWLMRQRKETRMRAFYELWSSREALFKLRSAQDSRPVQPRLLGSDDQLACRGRDWHRYSRSGANFALVVCCDQSLTELGYKELAHMTTADWRAASRA